MTRFDDIQQRRRAKWGRGEGCDATIGVATVEAMGGAVLESVTALVGAAVGDAMPK